MSEKRKQVQLVRCFQANLDVRELPENRFDAFVSLLFHLLSFKSDPVTSPGDIYRSAKTFRPLRDFSGRMVLTRTQVAEELER